MIAVISVLLNQMIEPKLSIASYWLLNRPKAIGNNENLTLKNEIYELF